MKKILLDTDIGSDIDDAACLAYLLSQPSCELQGITTVSGEPLLRAKIASAICKAAGKDIPIIPGAPLPLLGLQKQPLAPQAAKLENWTHDSIFPNVSAIEFMRKTIRANPNEITLLGIGPLTNIALLFRSDPEIPGLLKQLVLMHGEFTNSIRGIKPGDPLEWNALLDPYASAIVYTTPVKKHRSIGVEVTSQIWFSVEEVKRRFNHPVLKVVEDFSQVWFKSSDRLTFHDPLAGVSIFNETVCTYQRGTVEVELTSERVRGMTFFTPNAGSHEVAITVNGNMFLEEFFRYF